MACEKHQKDFVSNCSGCLKPLCPECVSIEREKRTYCFQCAMALSFKEEAQRREQEGIKEERLQEQASRKKGRLKKVLLYLALTIIVVEVGIVIAGRFFGHGRPPVRTAATVKQQQEYDYSACVANLAGLNSAVKIYKREKQGNSPPSLTSLVGRFFKVEPLCPTTGKAYHFTPIDGSYKIFCPNPEMHLKKSLYIESNVGLMVEAMTGGNQ